MYSRPARDRWPGFIDPGLHSDFTENTYNIYVLVILDLTKNNIRINNRADSSS